MPAICPVERCHQWAGGILIKCTGPFWLLSTEEEETCDAIQAMAEAMEGSLSGSTCTANSDCDAVTCQDITGKLKVEIDMCEDPPEVTLSGKDLSGSSYSYTFDHSTSVTSPTGTFTVILDWDSESKILGLEVSWNLVPHRQAVSRRSASLPFRVSNAPFQVSEGRKAILTPLLCRKPGN